MTITTVLKFLSFCVSLAICYPIFVFFILLGQLKFPFVILAIFHLLTLLAALRDKKVYFGSVVGLIVAVLAVFIGPVELIFHLHLFVIAILFADGCYSHEVRKGSPALASETSD
ncbi:hypothetical protein HXA31_00530 [Salipaludibacillus agaradhaerens]|uniref:Uncharacterized protein n=1 Tax=Salipaludibacillus agaradhaerens TaxID=76935 RepID=A0A9Q4G029_SALAG|nr:hypothetical protein [Salipaludibacillus agaradhaerens]MCR6097667.1 hypothetical protein [Salipaludibacillus agaradhaerens]MCR6112849.1 hypothetical protein [Salipaludibacillus agaradhaerens]UJW56718.1 hypothetical protein HXZ66_04480 [Bacillus sp. A116_S68]